MALMQTLVDNFSANDLATLWAGGYGTYTWSAGQVSVQCDSGYSSALTSSNSYDLTGSYIYAEIVPYVSSGAACNLIIGDSSNNVTLTYTNGQFECSITQGGSYGYIGDVGYSATSMAWWRIRESAGTIYFDTAPDGATWTNQFSTTYTMTITSMQATLDGGGATVTGYNVIKNVNTTGGTSVAGAAAASALAAPAGSASAGATVAGVVATAALAAPAGVPAGGRSVAGAAAASALAAPAGTPKASSSVAGPVAQLSLAAPAGSLPGASFDALPPAPGFPGTALGRRAELLVNGTWTDITTYLDHDPIVIGRGHPDESTQTSASTLAMTVTNTTGEFTSTNPLSALYPYLVRNIPCRVSIPEGASYLRSEADQASCAQAPGTGGLSITGDMDVRVDVTPDNGWLSQMCLASKWASSGGERSWLFTVENGGFLQFIWSPDGTTMFGVGSTVPVTVPAGRRMCARVTFQASGAVTFYTAPAGLTGASWAQLGAAAAFGSSSLFASTAPVQAGAVTGDAAYAGLFPGWQGKYHAMLVLSGVGGTTEGSPDFTVQTPGAASFSDAQGNTWTLEGTAEISSRNYRGHFEVPEWPQHQDPSGKTVTVAAAGGGLLRRLGQVNTPLQSPMRRAYTKLSATAVAAAPVAYWPMEDASAATQLASALGGTPMYFSGSPTLASSTAFACSAALPVANGATFTGRVPASSWTSNVTRFLMQVPSAGEANGAVIASVYTTGTVARLDLVYGTGGGLTLIGYSSAGAALFTEGPAAFAVNGALMRVSMELQPSGSGVQYAIATLAAGAAAANDANGTLATSSVGAVTAVVLNPNGTLTGTAFGHCSAQAAWDTLYDVAGALDAWVGETAAARFARLCGEEGIQCRVRGNPASTTAMGAQAQETLVQLLQECVDADRGVWTELRQCLGWGYVTRRALYNQAAGVTVDYGQDHLTEWASDAKEDDLTTLNDITLANTDGSSVRYTAAPGQPVTGGRLAALPPGEGGIGTYDNTPTTQVNLAYDKDLDNIANWMLRLGTVDEPRYPGIVLDLDNRDLNGLFNSIAQADLGDRMVILNPPAWLPPGQVSQLWQATQETIADFEYQIAVVGVPESPYEVAQAGVAHAATAGSQLASGCSPTAATLSVSTTAGSVWTTSGGDFPFQIMVAGEEMTVTNITGSSSPQAFTVTRSVNGVAKAQSSGAAVQVYPPPAAAL